jgi:hypothetical protein
MWRCDGFLQVTVTSTSHPCAPPYTRPYSSEEFCTLMWILCCQQEKEHNLCPFSGPPFYIFFWRGLLIQEHSSDFAQCVKIPYYNVSPTSNTAQIIRMTAPHWIPILIIKSLVHWWDQLISVLSKPNEMCASKDKQYKYPHILQILKQYLIRK